MTCNDCEWYTTDEDERGNVTEFHSARGKDIGFCVIMELFYPVTKHRKACQFFKAVDNGKMDLR